MTWADSPVIDGGTIRTGLTAGARVEGVDYGTVTIYGSNTDSGASDKGESSSAARSTLRTAVNRHRGRE